MLHDTLSRIADPRSNAERDLYFVSHCRELASKLISTSGPQLLLSSSSTKLDFQHLVASIPHMPPAQLFNLLHSIDFQHQKQQQQRNVMQHHRPPLSEQWLNEFDNGDFHRFHHHAQLDQQQIDEFERYFYHQHQNSQRHQPIAQNWVSQFKQFTPSPVQQLSQHELSNMEQLYQQSQKGRFVKSVNLIITISLISHSTKKSLNSTSMDSGISTVTHR